MKDQHARAMAELRAAFGGDKPRKPAQAIRQHAIAVTVNGIPASGPSVSITVTTSTVSKLEAEMAAMKAARERGLRLAVVTRIERTAP